MTGSLKAMSSQSEQMESGSDEVSSSVQMDSAGTSLEYF